MRHILLATLLGQISTSIPAQAELPTPIELIAAQDEQADQLFRMLETYADKQDLIYRLLIHAGEHEMSAAAKYLLINRALETATQAKLFVPALDALMALEASFKIDAYERFSETLNHFAASETVAPSLLCMAFLELAERSAESEQDARMRLALKEAREKARKDPQLLRWIRVRERELGQLHAAYQELAGPKASKSELAQYLCFYRGDWQQGLPHLSDADLPGPLRPVETKQAGAPKLDADQKVKIADAWLFRASKRGGAADLPELAVQNLQRQALHWYRLAWSDLASSRADRVRRQMDRLEDELNADSGLGHIQFATAYDMQQMVFSGPGWQVGRRGLVGDSAGGPTQASSRHGYTAIRSVTIRGGILSKNSFNFRFAVGDLMVIFNWELAPENHFYFASQRTVRAPQALSRGKEHDIRVRQIGEEVILFVDGKALYRTRGELSGAVSVYPSHGSEIFVREILVEGDLDGTQEFTAPPHGLR
ncbi:MAG: hypothetical protein ACYTG5_05650 [Planctomycetota bacterium]|jgi:hypothetical protein